ncbi:YheC/YheD family protein [Paenibacillus piri]|uniref:YheC/YheD family protein n=1 Tax=Paenibacillus piri TaxID=2547395 RepID=A0A4R5KRW1_9BACL|nr:YheC/YheD family protein [Paenibacillus piri]TDF97547.1 YheC/YheD family protein [Paenibacillus piri]
MQIPYVGILVNDSLYRNIPLGKTNHEAVKLYIEAGKELEVTPCFFRLQDFRSKGETVRAYVMNDNKKFIRIAVPIPKVIHNRAIHADSKAYRKLCTWSRNGIRLFNRWNRYGKLRIHRMLLENMELKPHLPATCLATAASVRAMMKQYHSLIIKPNNRSTGLGVMKLERKTTGWILTYPVRTGVKNQNWRTIHLHGQTLPVLLKRKLRAQKHIVQQCVPLATYKGRPFDLRVSVQRDSSGGWQITGIVAKVASKKCFLTNVAQGGTVYRLETILDTDYYMALNKEEVFRGIADLSLRIARHLGASLPHIADLGLDVGIDANGFPMIIECNGRDQRYSFREAGMHKEWRAAYFNPMAYAKFLLNNVTTSDCHQNKCNSEYDR